MILKCHFLASSLPLQAASRSPLFRRVSYEEMVHRAHYPESAGGVGGSGGVRGTLVTLTQWVLVLQARFGSVQGYSSATRLSFVDSDLRKLNFFYKGRREIYGSMVATRIPWLTMIPKSRPTIDHGRAIPASLLSSN